MAAGACGITAAKVDEALPFIQDGIASVTLAQPQMIASKLDRLMAAAKTHAVDLRLVVDSLEGLALLAARAADHRLTVGVCVKIDVGLHRCGCRPGDPLVETLAARIQQHPQLAWSGLLAHAGHAYGAADRSAVAAIAEDERRTLLAEARRLEAAGLPTPALSVGATPTVLAAERFDGLSEIRPGNYVFMDRTPLRMGLIERGQIALSVLTTVISRNPHFLIVDAGSKTFSSDTGAHGTGQSTDFGCAWPAAHFGDPAQALPLVRLSEEHGFIPRGNHDLPLGTRLRVLPNHACPVANLTPVLTVLGGHTVEEWPVDARGRVR
jgi:D-serine deaminase-like pyridoxal phosphate-dependent protein